MTVAPPTDGSAGTPARSEQLRTIVERMADGVVVVARDGTVRFANPAAETLFGRPAARLVGASFGFPLRGDDAQEIDVLRPVHGDASKGLETRAAELRVVDAEWDGEPVAVVSVRDITERNLAREREWQLAEAEAARTAAERSAALLTAVFESIPDAVYVRDFDVLTAVNGPALAQLGVSSLAALEADDRRRFGAPTPRDPATGRFLRVLEEPLARALHDGVPATRDLLIWHHGFAEERIVRCSAAPVRDAAGRVTGAVAIHTDVTAERQRADEREHLLAAAESASRAKSEFLAVMSHELRTPLNAIGGYAELLEIGVRGELTEQQRNDIARIQQSQQHLLGLVNQVLDLARTDAGELQVDSTLVRIGDTVDAALSLVRPQAAARAITLREEPGDAMDHAYLGDEPRVRQVLVNLLANAVKFTPGGGRVSVSCHITAAPPPSAQLTPGAPYVAIEVHDSGIGIEPDQLNRIFEPFTQAEGGLTRSRDGTGLGLTISRRLARLMNGDLTVASEVGVGSTFTLFLPTRERRVQPRAAAEGAVERRTPSGGAAVAVPHLDRISERLLLELSSVVREWIDMVRSDPAIPEAAGRSDGEIEDHSATFLTEVVLALRTMGVGGNPAAELRDGTAILAIVAERHGAQRARIGWSEGAIRREYEVLNELLDDAVRRIAMKVADRGAASQACAIIGPLLDQAARRSLAEFRLAVAAPPRERSTGKSSRPRIERSAE